MTAPAVPDVAVAVTTIGRPALDELLDSLVGSERRPVAVAIANQSGAPLPVSTRDRPFPVVVVPSRGGASRGRNDAVAALDGVGTVLAFPNDDSRYGAELLERVCTCFAGARAPDAIAVRLDEGGSPRFVLPPPGVELTKRTVWRAIEPAMFVRRDAFEAVGGFDVHLGTGAGTAWGSGEGTDLLLRLMARGGRVLSQSDLAVLGRGERRTLDVQAFVRKHRSYARGTGYVYRVHDYRLRDRLRTLVGPVVTATRQDDHLSLSLRLAAARLAGRAEGLTGRSLELRAGFGRRLDG